MAARDGPFSAQPSLFPLSLLFEQGNNVEPAQMSDDAAQTGEKRLVGTLRQPIAVPREVGIEGL